MSRSGPASRSPLPASRGASPWLLFALLVVTLCVIAPSPALARPTVSGVLVAYNPGGGRLQIRRADGVLKSVQLIPAARFELRGQEVSRTTFRLGMQVAVRVVGALNVEPLQGDLLTDFSSSTRYVARSATSPHHTPVGNYATGGGAGGVSPGLPSLGGPSVLGPLGMGGNFPGALTHPLEPIPHGNSAFPQVIQGPGGAAQPSPLGSPFTGEAIARQPGVSPLAPAPSPLQGFGTSPGAGPPPYGFGSPAGAVIGSPGGQPSSPASMFGGDEEEGEEGALGGFGGPGLGMQVLQFQGRLLSVDPVNRVLTVVPAGAAYPLQVSLPGGLHPVHGPTRQPVGLDGLKPGQGVAVHGLKNAAGMVEARAVVVSP